MTSQTQTARDNDPLFGANHLTVIRWVLASLVGLGHLWLLTEAYEPFRLYHWTGGYMAVNGFFVISGLLIAKSLHLRKDIKAYAISRTLRIYPALIAILLAFAFFFSPLFSDPGGISRITAIDTWQFVLRVLALGSPEGAPGGIFAGNIEEDFNGPLWTIRYEIAAYVMAAIAFLIGAVNGFKRTLILFVAVQSAYIGLPYLVDLSTLPEGTVSLFRLSAAFLMGMTLWHWPAARRPAWWIIGVLAVAFALFGASIVGELIANLLLTALILRLGLTQKRSKLLLKLPDYSYGIYIWHYPIMQAALFLVPGLGPFELMAISVPLVILASGLSWHLIEKPALRLKPGRKRPELRRKTVAEVSHE